MEGEEPVKKKIINLRHIKVKSEPLDSEQAKNVLFTEEDNDVEFLECVGKLSLDDLAAKKPSLLMDQGNDDVEIDTENTSLSEIIRKRNIGQFNVIDPKTMSLEEIIRNQNMVNSKRFENRLLRDSDGNSTPLSYEDIARPMNLTKRPLIDMEAGSVMSESDSAYSIISNMENKMSPIFTLKVLITSDVGVGVKLECHDMEIIEESGHLKQADQRKHRWKCQIYWNGQVNGVGEAPRKMLARHVAAWNLVEKLREVFEDVQIPYCSIPLGCYICPIVYTKLREACKSHSITPPFFKTKIHRVRKGGAFYSVTCFVKNEAFTGQDESETFGRRIAAKLAYEFITGQKFPLDEIYEDTEMCMGDNFFNCTETNITNIIFLDQFENIEI